MVPPPRFAAVPAALALLTLTGCAVTGTVEVGEQSMKVDLLIEERTRTASEREWGEAGFCQEAPFGALTVSPRPAPPGRTACHITGDVPATATLFGTPMVRTADHVYVTIPALRGYGLQEPIERWDVTVTLPGEVLATNGHVQPGGQAVRWSDVEEMTAQGAAVVARTAPRPLDALLGPGLGLVAGLAIGVGVTYAVLRARGRAAVNAPGTDPGEDTPPTPDAAPRSDSAPTGAPATPDPARSPASPQEPPEVWSRQD